MNKQFITSCFLFSFLFVGIRVQSQVLPVGFDPENPLSQVNVQLRSIFSPLYKFDPSINYLFEMSGHVTDTNWWANNTRNRINTTIWYKMYWEQYQMAYNQTGLEKDEEIYERVAHLKKNQIPLGIRDISMFKLKYDAFQTPKYFNINVSTNNLSDIAGRTDEPYTIKNVFSVAPLYATCPYNEVEFIIDKNNFFFVDANNLGYYNGTNYTLQINFGDGTGIHNFIPPFNTTYTAKYGSAGIHDIDAFILHDGVIIKESHSLLKTLGKTITTFTQASQSYEKNDLQVSVYNACTQDPEKRKVLIYLMGFDPGKGYSRFTRTSSDIYDEMIKQPRIAQLRNFGYEIHLVMWNKPDGDMAVNAMNLVGYLEYLKQTIENSYQFVIIGESMGGVIAKYAMTYMETPQYTNDPKSVKPERMHNTRLLITFDSPHQGANVPLAYQTLYNTFVSPIGQFYASALLQFTSPMGFALNALLTEKFLDSKAAKQLLIYHASTMSGTNYYKNYSCHQDRTDFLKKINLYGDFPKHTKIIALSNGKLNGTHQKDRLISDFRNANDDLVAMNTEIKVRILFFINVDIQKINFNLKTNKPNAGLINLAMGIFSPFIEFYWFGVRLKNPFSSYKIIDIGGANIEPYCTGPGGSNNLPGISLYKDVVNKLSGNIRINDIYSDMPFLGYLFNVNTSSVGNCFKASAGTAPVAFMDWMPLSAQANFSLCTNGTDYCFVPLQSALDYGAGLNLPPDYNIEAQAIITNLTRTPFHVLVGLPDAYTQNGHHLDVRGTFHNSSPGATNDNYELVNCPNLICNFLNKEIGDEELFIDNIDIAWSTTFDATQLIVVDGFNNPNVLSQFTTNPFYNILNVPYSNQLGFGGMYSKNNGTQLSNTGSILLNYWQNPFTTNYSALPISVDAGQNIQNCCVDLSKMAKPKPENNANLKQEILVYPNPTNGKIDLNYNVSTNENPTVYLYDLLGKLIATENLIINDGTKAINLKLDYTNLNLPQGIYLLRIDLGNKNTSNQKLIINN